MNLLKKTTMFLTVLLLFTATVISQEEDEVEVLYFKARLACCKARACNALQSDIEKAVEEISEDMNISFKVIRLSDPANKDLIEKYNAKSQTVVIYNKEENKAIDVTSIVNKYKRDRNKQQLANELKKKIDEVFES